MSVEEEIIRGYVNNVENGIYLRAWENVTMVYIQPIQKAGDNVYHFAYTTSKNNMMELYSWYIPKVYFDNELRKLKLIKLLS